MFKTITLTSLRNAEFIGFIVDVINLAKKYDLNALGLAILVKALEDSLKPLNDVFAQEKGNKLSEVIELADLRRDNAISGIKMNSESFLRHFNPAKKDAADTILRAINKYSSNIATLNYLQETETLRNLSADFETDQKLKDAIALLDLAEWCAELKDANENFSFVYRKRTEETSQKPEGNLKELRKPSKEQYDKFVQFIGAKQVITPSEAQANLIKELNATITQYNRLLATRGKGIVDDSAVAP